jgi:carbon-monoxide dehydrogenase medium subunit
MLRPFELHRPSTVAEAVDLLTQFGDDAAIYAGGTELLLLLKEGLLRVGHLVDVKRIAGLDSIALEDGWLSLGATATHRVVERSPLLRRVCPMLAGAAQHVANVRVRNVGTVGGNLAFADPHSDVATLLLALEGVVRVTSGRGIRELPIGGFLRGAYETAREPDEILTAVRFRPWTPSWSSAYVKFGLHERPTLGIATAVDVDGAGAIREARVSVGCVGPTPVRCGAAEERLRGCGVQDLLDDPREAGTLAAGAVDPVSDLHGSADYKREMVAVFARRALRIAAARSLGRPAEERYRHAVVA